MIVVGCGRAKLERSAPARELYVGSLFRAARAYAEASGQPWVILSGAHGVVDPAIVLRPYDQGVPETELGIQRWARTAALEIERRRKRAKVVVILAGTAYATPLARELAELGIESSEPLRGLGLGLRIQRLYAMAESLQSPLVERRAAEGNEGI